MTAKYLKKRYKGELVPKQWRNQEGAMGAEAPLSQAENLTTYAYF